MEKKILYVVQGDHSWLHSRSLKVEQLSWVAGHPPIFPFKAMAKTRYRQPDQACTITEDENGYIHVEFEQPQRAVTPGQSVVFYLNDDCLGGGIIISTDAPGVHP